MAHMATIIDKDSIQSTAVITTAEKEMKEFYEQILSEPIPNRFLLVLKDLEKAKEKIIHWIFNGHSLGAEQKIGEVSQNILEIDQWINQQSQTSLKSNIRCQVNRLKISSRFLCEWLDDLVEVWSKFKELYEEILLHKKKKFKEILGFVGP